jgi:hypothetical protein
MALISSAIARRPQGRAPEGSGQTVHKSTALRRVRSDSGVLATSLGNLERFFCVAHVLDGEPVTTSPEHALAQISLR